MKKIYLYAILATFASMSMLTSCDADAEFETEVPVNPVMRPIISLTAMEQEDIFEGVIDDNKRTIKLEVEAWTDLSNMTVFEYTETSYTYISVKPGRCMGLNPTGKCCDKQY